MLKSLSIRQFKAFDSVEVPFGKTLTVLAGPNGAGKSTVLQAVDLLGGVVRGSISEWLGSHGWAYSDLPHLRARDSRMAFDARLALSGEELQWSFELGTRRYPGVSREEITDAEDVSLLSRKGRSMTRLVETSDELETIRQTLPASWLSVIERRDAKVFPRLVEVAGWARGIHGYFFLDPVKLRAATRGDHQDIGPHGERLAVFLRRLRERSPEGLRRVIERVRQHYPRLQDIVVKRQAYGWTSLEIRERHNGDALTFNARQVSDGLLRLLAVSALHELPGVPSMILLDEIENGLHPRLLGGLVTMLEELAAARGVQVLAATHSPLTLNYVRDPDSVLLVTRSKRGRARITPLSESRGFAKLRRVFELGELWYNAGEDRLVK